MYGPGNTGDQWRLARPDMIGIDIQADNMCARFAAKISRCAAKRFCQHYRSAAMNNAHVLLRSGIDRQGTFKKIVA